MIDATGAARKISLGVAVSVNLGLLAVFKYADFVADILNRSWRRSVGRCRSRASRCRLESPSSPSTASLT